MPSVAEIKVAALEFAVTTSELAGLWTAPDGARERFRIGATRELIPRIDALRAELRDPMAVATGSTPRLREFSVDWGRAFLPPAFEHTAPDVVVVVPHGPIHDLPIHLIDALDRPLGTRTGVSYCSSRSQFLRTVSRNPGRRRDAAQWRLGESPAVGAAAGAVPPRSVMSGGVDVLADLDEAFEAICRQVAAQFDGERVLFVDRRFPYSRMAAKAALRRKPTPSVLCVMAHGWVDLDNHSLSGLLLARDASGSVSRAIPLHGGRYFDFRDLPLRRAPLQIRANRDIEVFTAAELEVDSQIACELVMLLGCSAGWGRVLQGDEPASLAETWLKIGAASVVAPLWDAPIAAVRAWTEDFLHGWNALDLPKALAWRHAMQRLFDGDLRDAPERLGVMTLRGDWL